VTRFRDQRPHVGLTSRHVEALLTQDRKDLHRWDALRQVESPGTQIAGYRDLLTTPCAVPSFFADYTSPWC
jgi:hypothetical protein